MKGYRKLKEGEIVKKGDMFKSDTVFQIARTFWFGDEYDGDRAYSFYRPIKSKKIQKRIDLTGRIHDILDTTSANWIKVKKISILIANNYRRRAR